MYCSKCGYNVQGHATVCPRCGKQMKPNATAPQNPAYQKYPYAQHPPAQPQQKRQSNIPVIIGCVVGGIVLIVFVLILIGILADDIPELDDVNRDDSAVSGEDISDASDEEEAVKSQFVWIKEPFFDADDMSVIHDYRSYIDTKYVVCYLDGKSGLVDTNGNIVCDPVYSNPYYCDVCNGVSLDYSYNANSRLFEFDTGRVVEHGGHGGSDGKLVYDLNSRSFMYICYGDGPSYEVDYNKSGCYVVYEAYKVLYDYSYEAYYDYSETGRLGLYFNGELVVPFEYELATDVAEGVVGMYDGETWTYFAEDGTVILDNVATNSDVRLWYKPKSSDLNEYEEKYNEWVYEFSCGCVPVKKDGKWGYMNKNGEMIVDAQFEKALPAYENRAWVCVDGLWGIIELS